MSTNVPLVRQYLSILGTKPAESPFFLKHGHRVHQIILHAEIDIVHFSRTEV